MIPYDDSLRTAIVRNLDAHDRREHPLGGHRHAAVAVVLVDSEPDDHEDPCPVGDDQMKNVPGDVEGLDGRVFGVAGGAAFLLCR